MPTPRSTVLASVLTLALSPWASADVILDDARGFSLDAVAPIRSRPPSPLDFCPPPPSGPMPELAWSPLMLDVNDLRGTVFVPFDAEFSEPARLFGDRLRASAWTSASPLDRKRHQRR